MKMLGCVALAAVSLALTATNVSARIVCTPTGDCWHVHADYDYPPVAGVIIHPDTWRWANGEPYKWREHAGRGYWHGDTWTKF